MSKQAACAVCLKCSNANVLCRFVSMPAQKRPAQSATAPASKAARGSNADGAKPWWWRRRRAGRSGAAASSAAASTRPKRYWRKRQPPRTADSIFKFGREAFNPFNSRWGHTPLSVPGVLVSSTYTMSQTTAGFNLTNINFDVYILLQWSNHSTRYWILDGTTINDTTVEPLHSSGAAEIRAGRLAISCSNISSGNDIGGSIRVHEFPDPLQLTFTSNSQLDTASRDSLHAICEHDGNMREYSGMQAAQKPVVAFCTPVNMQKMQMTFPFIQHVSGQEQAAWNAGALNSPLSTCVLHLRPGSSSQTWSFVVKSADFLRWPENSLLSSQHRPPPQRHEHFMNAATQRARDYDALM